MYPKTLSIWAQPVNQWPMDIHERAGGTWEKLLTNVRVLCTLARAIKSPVCPDGLILNRLLISVSLSVSMRSKTHVPPVRVKKMVSVLL